MQSPIVTQLKQIFLQHFGEPDCIVRSPGRINLIGEHTDYNLGFVLPAAIDKAIYIAIQKRADREIHLVAADLSEIYTGSLNALTPSNLQWPNFILGVVAQLQQLGHQLTGFNAAVSGDVPLGAGLSSSAAVECATAFALNTLFGLELSRKTMVQVSQKAENEFVGLQCGIMDMFASMFGKSGHLIQLDCRSLEYQYIPFDTSELQIVLMDTGVKHSLASSEYNLRRQECEEGVRLISQKYPDIKSLRDANINMVNECLATGSQLVYNRCKYVVEEIQRLQDGCKDLVKNDMVAFGKKMFATHDGLSRLYAVSCAEADALVEAVTDDKTVLGARMMGGGFGGCTINLVRKTEVDALLQRVKADFYSRFSRDLKTYTVNIDEGTSLVKLLNSN